MLCRGCSIHHGFDEAIRSSWLHPTVVGEASFPPRVGAGSLVTDQLCRFLRYGDGAQPHLFGPGVYIRGTRGLYSRPVGMMTVFEPRQVV